jgi:hypothetical protein
MTMAMSGVYVQTSGGGMTGSGLTDEQPALWDFQLGVLYRDFACWYSVYSADCLCGRRGSAIAKHRYNRYSDAGQPLHIYARNTGTTARAITIPTTGNYVAMVGSSVMPKKAWSCSALQQNFLCTPAKFSVHSSKIFCALRQNFLCTPVSAGVHSSFEAFLGLANVSFHGMNFVLEEIMESNPRTSTS